MNEEEIREKARQLRAAGASVEQVKQYLASKGFEAGTAPTASANLPDHDPPEIEPTYAQQALGGIASLVRDIPGAEAAQAGVRALVRRQPYREALSDIRGAEDSAPSIVRNGNRLLGGGIAAAVLPGGAAMKGAQYGALTGALSSDPNSGLESRGIQAGTGAVAGALVGRYAGKLGDKLAPAAGRARDALITRFALRDAVQPAVRLGEASASKAEGFLGNGIGNLSEAAAEAGPRRLGARSASLRLEPNAPTHTEGFVGNSMDNVLEAVKAQNAGGDAASVLEHVKASPRQPMYDAFSNEARAADQASGHTLRDVVKATERYRTESGRLQQGAPNARFDMWKERLAKP